MCRPLAANRTPGASVPCSLPVRDRRLAARTRERPDDSTSPVKSGIDAVAFVAVLACAAGAVCARVGVAPTHASATNPRKLQCLFMPTSLSLLQHHEALARSPGSHEILKCRRAHPALPVIDGASAGPMSGSVSK